MALVKGNYYYNIKLKNTNIITCVVTRYQARYNIHALALVKGNYYYNIKLKNTNIIICVVKELVFND